MNTLQVPADVMAHFLEASMEYTQAAAALVASLQGQGKEPVWVSTGEAAVLVGCNAQRIRQWARSGRIRSRKASERSILVAKEDLPI